VVTPGYAAHLHRQRHQEMLASREELDYEHYANFYNFSLPGDGSELTLPAHETGAFRLVAMRDHKRIYERLS
jgi:hydroxymethylglutaryl-CoA synthase